jgi:geranylgeranyl reductase family protein
VHDAVVIGAGPAGSVAAERLARLGHHVVVLEEHETVGVPVHCTGLLGVDAFEEFGLPSDLALRQADRARFWGTAGQSFAVSSERVRAAIIDRVALDRCLAERAVAAGADLRRGWGARSIHVDEGRVTVIGADRRTVVARTCVLAAGANYRFHKALGLGRPELFLQSAQLETPFPPSADIEVQFGREVAPAGFAWIVPFNRGGVAHARIGLMSETRARARFDAFVRTLHDRAGWNPGAIPEPRLKILPLGPIARTFAHRVVAVGDAAGLVKPTTGGGIYYGMLSGQFAAETLDEGLRRDRLQAADLRPYESRWHRRLGADIRMGMTFRRIAQTLSDDSIDALIELGRANGVVPILQRTASFNWHRKAAAALLGHAAFRRILLAPRTRDARTH